MGIETIGRIIILNGTESAVEAETAALAEIVFGRNSATGAIGYSVDDGTTWTWLPIGADDLDSLSDVVITDPVSGQIIKFDGSNWINETTTTGELLVDNNEEILWDDDGDVLYED